MYDFPHLYQQKATLNVWEDHLKLIQTTPMSLYPIKIWNLVQVSPKSDDDFNFNAKHIQSTSQTIKQNTNEYFKVETIIYVTYKTYPFQDHQDQHGQQQPSPQ